MKRINQILITIEGIKTAELYEHLLLPDEDGSFITVEMENKEQCYHVFIDNVYFVSECWYPVKDYCITKMEIYETIKEDE